MGDQRVNQSSVGDGAPVSEREPRLRVFCFPYAGAGPSIFRSWQAGVADSIQICAVPLPGREARFGEPPFRRLKPLIEAVADSIQPLLDLPIALFGHCMGALVAFELARYLRRQGCEPIHLVVSGLPAPRYLAGAPLLHRLPPRDFVSALRWLNGISDELLQHPEFLELMLPTMRADFEVCETYRYRREPPLRCRISAYAGRRDPRSPSHLIRTWRAETSGKFTARFFPGSHFFIDSARTAVLSAVSIDLLGALFTERSSASV